MELARVGGEGERTVRRRRSGAALVAAGILLSRLVGFVREWVFAHYFGASDAADAFKAALRIPNLLQNLFGEGVLSASFIPVYAALLERGDEREATDVAAVVATLLAIVVAVLVAAGWWGTPYLIDAVAPGFSGAKREATIDLVRILFPGTGLLVLSAWCLGVLNSHRRFFLSYAAPVVWSGAIIAALVGFGGARHGYALASAVAWAAVGGAALQIAVQLPTVLVLVRGVRPRLAVANAHVREVFRNFTPVVVSRGVVQISAYVDGLIASLLPTGALAAFTYAQLVYTLPIALFGMSISASELPEMSRALGSAEEIAATLRRRLDRGLERIAFLVVPSAVAFLTLGDVICGVLFQSGRFTHADAVYVWGILAGSSIGLLAATMGRLYASTWYALHDTRRPLVFAVVRVTLTGVLGWLCALPLPAALGIEPRWGAVGLTASAGVAGWVEFLLLRRYLVPRIGRTGVAAALVLKLWAGAILAALLAWGVKLGLASMQPDLLPLVAGPLVLVPFGVSYFAFTAVLGVPAARQVVGSVLLRLRGRG